MNVYSNIQKLANLKKGWDGYEAEPIPDHMLCFLKSVIDNIQFVPGADGSVQIEIHHGWADIEIDVSKNCDICGIYFRSQRKEKSE